VKSNSPTWVLVTALGAALAGCSLNLFPRAECGTNADCRAAFGRGWICVADDGLCAVAPPQPRCSSFPADLLGDLASHEDDIVIGNMFDQDAFFGMQLSARLAVIQVNTRDGLNGTLFGMIECDNTADFEGDGLGDPEATAVIANYLTDVIGLPAIVGPATSTRAEVAFNTSSPLGTMHISPSATSPTLTPIDGATSSDEDPGLFWRTAPPDTLQGEVIALEMAVLDRDGDGEPDVDLVGIVAQVGAYGEGLAEVFQLHYTGSSELITYTDVSELGPIAAQFNAAEYDAVLVISSSTSQIADFLNAASAPGLSGYPDKTLFLPDGAFSSELIEGSQDLASDLYPNVRGTRPHEPSGLAYNTFVASYNAVFNPAPNEMPGQLPFPAHSYDAAWLVIAGVAWADANEEDGITGLGIARGMRQVSEGAEFNTGPNDWNSVKAAFADGDSVDINGASGSLDFDPVTGETAAPVDVWQIISDGDGGFLLDIMYCVDVSPVPDEECVEAGGG
jgi:branched-chain amino acid transport system substrate-binding protein